MKKILSILLSVSIVFGIGSSALADGQYDKEEQKAYKLIEKTNKEIAHKIDKAVAEADKLQAKYYKDVLKLEEKEEVAEGDLRNETESTVNEGQGLIAAKQENSYDHFLFVEEENKVIASILTLENVECGNLKEDEICKVENGEVVYYKYKDLTDKYLEELNKIIRDVYNETREMSLETIIRVEKVGVTAKCDWVAVDFAHFTVWIDPIRVVGV